MNMPERRVLAIVTNYGVEQDELLVPVARLHESGARVDIAAPELAPIRTLVGDKDPGEEVQPTMTIAEADSAAYDLLLIPGGTINADTLRLDESAVWLVGNVASGGRPIAAICHGPWAIVEAGMVRGKTMTSYPSLRTDIRNAGGTWVDRSVVSDEAGGWTLITSRNPGDLDDFCEAIAKVLG